MAYIVGAIVFIGVIIFCIGFVKLLKKHPCETEPELDLELGVPLEPHSQTALTAQRGGLPTLLRNFNHQACHQSHSDHLDELTTRVKFLEHEVEHLKKKLAESQEVQCSALSTHHSGRAADGLPAAEVKAETIVEITAEAPAEADTATAYIECRLPSSEGFYDIHPVWTKVCEFLQISELGRLSLGKKHSNFQKFFKAELHLYRKRKDKASDEELKTLMAEMKAIFERRRERSRWSSSSRQL